MSTEYASIADLTADEVTTAEGEDFELPDGKKIRIRGMSRWEQLQAGKGTEDNAEIEARILSFCSVTPRLTAAQVTAVQKGKPPMYLAGVYGRIREMSGLAEGAAKSDVAGDGADGA